MDSFLFNLAEFTFELVRDEVNGAIEVTFGVFNADDTMAESVDSDLDDLVSVVVGFLGFGFLATDTKLDINLCVGNV